MLRTETVEGRSVRRAAGRELAVFGARDVDLLAREDGQIALSGYVVEWGRALRAGEVLDRWNARGVAGLGDLGGEFSLAIWTRSELVLARDRHGARPLYVGELPGGGVVFSTAIAPLLAAGVRLDPDRDAVVRSLVLGYVPAPQTAVATVRQVAAGEALWLLPRRRSRRYFHPTERIVAARSLARAAQAVDAAVTAAVERALPPTGRVGAFLSGGIDSSLVLARVHETGRPVEAFTLHFGDHLPSELRYARAVADHLGVRHHVLELDDRGFCDGIELALLHLEDLLSEPIAVPNFLLAREAARSCDVLFTGEGGDPCFGGPKNIGLVLARMYQGHPSSPTLAEAYQTAHHHLADDLDIALGDGLRAAFDGAALRRVLVRQVSPRGSSAGETFVGTLMRANVVLKGSNNILVKVAKMVGAHDLMLRSPLFDPDLVALALTIPPWQKLSGTEEKLVLKRAAERSLPAPVIARGKRGMAVPLGAWLGGALGELARDVLTARTVRDRGFFRWPYVERLLRRERLPSDLAHSRSHEKLWLVLVTELQQRALARLARRRAS
jgi:asparagine synthase (glutamine-hydrolysing)